MRVAVALASALTLASCAADGVTDRAVTTQGLAEELSGFEQGETQDCLPAVLDSVSPRIVDDRTIVYQQSRVTKWISSLPNACPGLRPTSTLLIQRFGSRTCKLDSFNAFAPGPAAIPGPLCNFGAFVRYDQR